MEHSYNPRIHKPHAEILVVDDDPLFASFIKTLIEIDLERFPMVATSGYEALKILGERSIGTVVTDLSMPLMDGLTLLKKIKERYPETRVIVLSADFESFQVTPEQIVAMGAIAALKKSEVSKRLVPLIRDL